MKAHIRRRLPALLLALLVLLVAIRCWVPAVTYAHFDSDQAVYGIMARDLASGRGFPLFMYGQLYLLAVSVWLSAPLFAIFGANIVTLELPMVAMNVAVVVMLWVGLRRERGVGPMGAALAALPFAMPNALATTRLLEHAGGIEPFVFVLGAFFLRRRPLSLGLCMGVGFLNREFALIGLFALLMMDALQGDLLPRWRQHLQTVGVAALVVVVVRNIAPWSTSFHGPSALVGHASPNNLRDLVAQQLPSVFGTAPRALADFNVLSQVTVGHTWVAGVLLVALAALCVALVWWSPLKRDELNGMAAYLVLVGAGQAAAYVLLAPTRHPMVFRYVLLTLLGPAGLAAFAWRRPPVRVVAIGAVVLWSAANLHGNLQLMREYTSAPPVRDLNVLADALLQRRVRYAQADYWTAFDVAWLTDERIILSPPRHHDARIARFSDELDRHPGEVYTLTTEPCAGGEAILRWYLCAPAP